MAILKDKEYMYNFIGGGWNTVWAKTIRGARKQAIQQWADTPDLTVDIDSVRLATTEDKRTAMRNFW